MSGIVGIVNFDGATVDRALLRRMTDFMTFRGPDEQRIWVDGNVGFGHTLLRTTFESEHEHQPFTLDGRTWIVADARVDAQADLIAKLNAHGEHVKAGVTDVELLLRAYHVWGEGCVDHLLGDFAFAIWDGPQRRLFCARDHLGVKPFFYAHLGATLIFSSGGLDSPTLAATACKILRERSANSELRAFTTVCDSLDGGERHYAGLVAEKLNIPIDIDDSSNRSVDPRWSERTIHTTEPI